MLDGGLQVPDDMNHAHEMEMEQQKTIEEDMKEQRNGIIQALMKRAGGGVLPSPRTYLIEIQNSCCTGLSNCCMALPDPEYCRSAFFGHAFSVFAQ